MALISINRNPEPSQLRWFAVFWFPAFWVLLAAIVFHRTGNTTIPLVLAAIGITLGLIALISKSFARALWIGWMTVIFPIGFVVSHVIVLVIFYLVFTPVGWMLRLAGKDPMNRKFDRAASTYWVDAERNIPAARYFRQF